MKIMTELDYVTLYAKKLRGNNEIFAQQKLLIESQLHSSASLFAKMFGRRSFKTKARAYLRQVGIL